MRKRITKTVVDHMQPGEIITDSELHGFRVRAGPIYKVYSVQKRIGQKVITRTIGRQGPFTPDQARKEAQRLLHTLAQGRDPLVEKRRLVNLQTLTFGKLLELYCERRLKESTRRDIESKVRKHLVGWLKVPANDIARSTVIDTFRKLRGRGETQAALVMRYARAVFNYGIKSFRDDRTGESDIRQNPVNVLKDRGEIPRARRRDTYIPRSQFPAWLAAVEETRQKFPTLCDYLVFTLLSGCRRSESAHLKWADVDLKEKNVIFRNTKNGTDHRLPTGHYLTQLLQRRRAIVPRDQVFVFPSKTGRGPIVEPRDAMEAITARSGVNFKMHDLRRTFLTIAESLDISSYALKRLANHSTGPSRDVTEGYIITDVERLRDPMQQIEDAILTRNGGGVKAESRTEDKATP